MSGPTVLKLGGSLIESGQARILMHELAALAPARLIIVPGGGAFADAVRRAQIQHPFAERAAHHMALLAMHMCALMLADWQPRCVPAADAPAFDAAWRAGRMPIWVPERMALADAALPVSWDFTSDSLAAWLAQRLGARRLILVKSVTVAEPMDAPALARAGIVDPCFPDLVRGAEFDWCVVTGVAGALEALR